MPGSGVRSSNIASIEEKTKAKEFHASARISLAGHMEFKNKALAESPGTISIDEAEVKKLKEFCLLGQL
jgi:copper homeostasis protein